MNTPHKHKDLIIAWANGAEIQYLDSSGRWYEIASPNFSPSSQYRIKLQPKKCRVALMNWTNSDGEAAARHPLYEPKTYKENFFEMVEKDGCFVKWISPVIEYFEE